VLERVFQQWQELRVFFAQQGYPISTSFQGNFWLYLNLNSLSRIVQPFTYEEIDWGFSCVVATRRKRQDTTHVKLKLMKVDFPAHEVCTIPNMDKKRTSFAVIAPAKFHSPVVKNVILTLFQGRFS